MKKNVVKYKEKHGNASISVEIETPLRVGDTLKFVVSEMVYSHYVGLFHDLPVGVEHENTRIMKKAFLIDAPDEGSLDWYLHGREPIIFPPYAIGNVERIEVIKKESSFRSEDGYRLLYTIGFDVDYGDGEKPKHYCVKTLLRRGFAKVPYKVNSLNSFYEYKEWLKRKEEEFSVEEKNLSEYKKKWLEENPCPM